MRQARSHIRPDFHWDKRACSRGAIDVGRGRRWKVVVDVYHNLAISEPAKLCGLFRKNSRLPVAASAYRGPALGFVTEHARCQCLALQAPRNTTAPKVALP